MQRPLNGEAQGCAQTNDEPQNEAQLVQVYVAIKHEPCSASAVLLHAHHYSCAMICFIALLHKLFPLNCSSLCKTPPTQCLSCALVHKTRLLLTNACNPDPARSLSAHSSAPLLQGTRTLLQRLYSQAGKKTPYLTPCDG